MIRIRKITNPFHEANIRIAELADNSFVPLEGIKLAKQEEKKIEAQKRLY